MLIGWFRPEGLQQGEGDEGAHTTGQQVPLCRSGLIPGSSRHRAGPCGMERPEGEPQGTDVNGFTVVMCNKE